MVNGAPTGFAARHGSGLNLVCWLGCCVLRRLAVTVRFCKADELDDTGDPFRSSDLGVMSPARLPLRHAGEGCCECECECVLLAFCVA